MLYRKYENRIEYFLRHEKQKILLVNGARQIGKSYLIRYVGKRLFKHYIEINLKEDAESVGRFRRVHNTTEFYLQLSALYGTQLGDKDNTLIFLDEIQAYPHLLTMLKFLNQEQRFTYIASGSQLGIALSETPSIPIGSIAVEQMYPLDFEEFLYAMGCGKDVIETAREAYLHYQSVSESLHEYFMYQFRLYLLIGGLPEAINQYAASNNIALVRKIHADIYALYRLDASQYDTEHKLLIRRIYDMIPSSLENKKKRLVFKNITSSGGHKQFADFADEFEYLVNSGIALSVQAISNPRFPLIESEHKNLFKLYLNDVGLLTHILYGNNINAILQDETSINMGTVYESVVAQELAAHGNKLHYYDNKKHGEVDYLVEDYSSLQVMPIEVKSGKDYNVHSALNAFLSISEYNIHAALVFNNAREVSKTPLGVTYFPVYYCMFIQGNLPESSPIVKPMPSPKL